MNAPQRAPKTVDIMKQLLARLRSADPDAFEQFVACFDVYATEITVAVTEAPQEHILNAQGRAQQCLALLRAIRECHLQRPQQAPGQQAP
jgi:hypothetical protein